MPSPKVWHVLVVGLLSWGIATATQYLSGSYQAELSWSVDEPAHYVSGLMVTEYLRQGMPGNPLRFAENYYVHYPKVAIGSWPPVFYGVQGIWGLLFGSSKVSIFLLIGFLMALGSAGIFWVSQPFVGVWGGAAVAIAYVLVPVSRFISAVFMAEPLIAILAFAATAYFGMFLGAPTWRNGILYALFVSLTTLTKGTGVALVLVPPIAIIILRQWRLLISPVLWAAALIVILSGGLWTFLTVRIVSEGWAEQPGMRYALKALVDEPIYVWNNIGPILFGLALVGGWWAIGQRVRMGIAMLAGVLGVFVFYTIPAIGLEMRYFHVVVPMVLVLSAIGLNVVAQVIPVPRSRETLAAVIVAICLWRYFPVPPKPHYGVDQAASTLVSKGLGDCVVLISSNVDLEGMLISEVAFRQHGPALYLLRSTKALARSNWRGSDYQLRYPNASAVYDFLERSPVNLLVADTFPQLDKERTSLHHTQVREVLERHSADWEKIHTFPSALDSFRSAEIEIYRHRRKPCVPNPRVEVDMGGKMQRSFTN